MQRMEWRNGSLRPVTGKAFLGRILLAHVRGMTPAEFAEQELRRMQCAYCRDGVPTGEDGQHYLAGVVLPCAAGEKDGN